MQSIYHLTIWFIAVTLSRVRAQLLYTDPSRDDGPCKYPSPVPLFNANFLINPFQSYYIPVASENFYRFEYHMANNMPAQTEDDVISLQTRVGVSISDFIEDLAAITVSFFGSRDVHYSYRIVPSLMPSSISNPLFDYNATTIHGSKGTASTGFAGEVIFTIIWNDYSPAWNIYTCIGGRQMFHIMTGKPYLTNEQLETNKKLLIGLGFKLENFQFLQYNKIG